MNKKQLYQKIKEDVSIYKKEVLGLKEAIEQLFIRILKSIAEIESELPSEKDFFDLIATIICDIMNINGLFAGIGYFVIRKLLDIIDNTVLDKLLGSNWYDRLKKLIPNK